MSGPPQRDVVAGAGARRRRGLGLGASALMAAALGLLVVGSAVLKTRHLRHLAHRVAWQPAGFELGRPDFDRLAFERDPRGSGAMDHLPAAQAVADLRRGMRAYLHGDVRTALSAFRRSVRREPRWPLARFYLGASLLLSGHPLAAAKDLATAQAAGFVPSDGPVAWWLGLAWLYAGEEGAGRRQLSRVADSGAVQAEMAQLILAHLSGPLAATTAGAP